MVRHAVVVLLGILGCQGEQVTSAVADAATDSTDSAAGDNADAATGCGEHPGPRMVRATTSKGTFCVDTTEVSNAQYAEFSAATNEPAMPAYCKFKAAYSVANPLPAAKDCPVVNVDWCDADQYCAWAGKRVCGGTAFAAARNRDWS